MAKKIDRKLEFNPVRAGYSLHHVHKSHFRRLRRLLFEKHGPRCQICGYQPKDTAHLNAHEDWSYFTDDNGCTGQEWKDKLEFYLVDIVLICRRCHSTIHMNWRTAGTVQAGPKHYCEVNGCSAATFRRDFAAALAARKEFWALKQTAETDPSWFISIDLGFFEPGEDYDDPWEARPMAIAR